MYETLFHPALWMPVAVLLVGVVFFLYGNSRTQTPVRNAGAGVAALAVGWYVVALFVATPVEQCISRTRQIIAAVEGADWPGLQGLLDRNTALDGFGLRGAELITTATRTAAEQYGLKQINILRTESTVTEPEGGVDVVVNTFIDGVRPTTGRFRFAYERRSDGMLLRSIQPIAIGGNDLAEARRRFGR